jgi:hypothetical protein
MRKTVLALLLINACAAPIAAPTPAPAPAACPVAQVAASVQAPDTDAGTVYDAAAPAVDADAVAPPPVVVDAAGAPDDAARQDDASDAGAPDAAPDVDAGPPAYTVTCAVWNNLSEVYTMSCPSGAIGGAADAGSVDQFSWSWNGSNVRWCEPVDPTGYLGCRLNAGCQVLLGDGTIRVGVCQ